MRILFIFAAMAPLLSFGQTREIYGGLNTSNYFINQEGITGSRNYIQGAQVGFMMGGKPRNLFGNLKRISPFVSFEYNLSRYDFTEVRDELETNHSLDAHSLRVSVPIQFRLSKNDKRAQFYVSGAPGVNVTGLQFENGQMYYHAPIKNVDLFVNAGAGVLFNTSKKSYDTEGFKFSGLTLSADKYIPISLGRMGTQSISSLDQYQFNVGLRFSHYKKPASKKILDIFKKKG